MKLKQLLASALLLCSIGATAQTDVTSTYITNADFSSTDGWTQDHSSQYWSLGNGKIGTFAIQNNKTSSTDATHLATEYCFGMQCRWSTNYAAFTQTTPELPIGSYTLTYDVQNKNASNNLTYENRFKVTVGGNTYTDTKKEWMNGSSDWTTHTITFNVTEASTATISLGYGTSSNNIGTGSTPHLYVSHLSLTWTDPLKASKDALQAEIDKAKLCDAKEGLADAIAAAEGVLASATTTAELEDALAVLQAADKDAVLRYENGLADATALTPVATDFVVNGTFTDNVSGWTCTGGFQNQARASNQNGAFTVPFFENWNGSAKVNKMYQTINNIPNGTYRLDIAAFVNTLADPNESQYVFANSDKVYLTTGEPTAYEVYTVVTNNQIEIGLEQTTATANWMGIDNVSLRYYGAGDVVSDAQNAAHKLGWLEAKAAAEAARDNSDYENVDGSEKASLLAEIAKAEPATAESYDAAAAALTSATQTFVNAKSAYDIFATYNTTLAYADSNKKPVITDESTAASIIPALRAYYESNALAEGVVGAEDVTSSITNANNPANNDGWTWTGNKNNPASNEPWTDADGTNSHTYFDGGNWGGTSWTTTMSQDLSLPAGTYLLTAKGRAAANTNLTLSVGEDNVALPNIGSAGNVFDRGWGDASVEFTTDGRGVTILVTATAEPIHEWFSVSDFRLVRLSLNAAAYADAGDYEALNSAIADAEANTLGFQQDEYAPYNNIEALQLLADAKAIDQDAVLTNLKEDVQAATAALEGATWTNNGEKKAPIIYNGMFATVAEGQNYPDGWTRTNGWGQMQSGLSGDYATAYYNQPGSLQYGNQGLYTMPLRGNSAYAVSFSYRSHENNSNKGVTVSVKNVTTGEYALEEVTFGGNSSTSEWKSVEASFATPVDGDGNYVLTIANNGNTWITNVKFDSFGNYNGYPSYLIAPFYEDYGLDDGYKDEGVYPHVTLERSYKGGLAWNTFVVPFDVTNEELMDAMYEDVEVAEFSETVVDEVNENVTVSFTTMETPSIKANTPVLIRTKLFDSNNFDGEIDFGAKRIIICDESEAKVEGTIFDFVAVYKYFDDSDEDNPIPFTIAENDYFIGNNALYKSAGTTTIKPFRAYLKNKTGQPLVKANLYIDGIATSIDEINGTEATENGAIYTIAGQRVQKAQKGLYIVNGKKVLVK